jgi:hypothetical protein
MNWWVAGGAKISVMDPTKRRAIVEVMAIMLTCVEADPAGGGDRRGYDVGVKEWITVPSCIRFSLNIERS